MLKHTDTDAYSVRLHILFNFNKYCAGEYQYNNIRVFLFLKNSQIHAVMLPTFWMYLLHFIKLQCVYMYSHWVWLGYNSQYTTQFKDLSLVLRSKLFALLYHVSPNELSSFHQLASQHLWKRTLCIFENRGFCKFALQKLFCLFRPILGALTQELIIPHICESLWRE